MPDDQMVSYSDVVEANGLLGTYQPHTGWGVNPGGKTGESVPCECVHDRGKNGAWVCRAQVVLAVEIRERKRAEAEVAEQIRNRRVWYAIAVVGWTALVVVVMMQVFGP